jgi:hypothetical protein
VTPRLDGTSHIYRRPDGYTVISFKAADGRGITVTLPDDEARTFFQGGAAMFATMRVRHILARRVRRWWRE